MNEDYIIFRATIKGLSQNTNPEWNETKYLGRADRVYNYIGFSRDLSFNFRVYAGSYDELEPMWQRIDRLQGLCYPSKNEKITGLSNDYNVIVPPFSRITIGDMYYRVPVLIKSFSISIPDESSWEIGRNGKDRFPMIADISISTTMLEEAIPSATNVRFGQNKTVDVL